jgi:hypothetical protein
MAEERRVRKRAADREQSPAGEDSPLVRLLRSLYRPLPLSVLACWLGFATLRPHVVKWLPDLQQRTEYRLAVRDIRLNSAGAWVPEDLVQEVVTRAELPDPLPLLDPGLTERVAKAFANHPWVKNVRSVRTSRSYGLVVDVEYRVPILMVQTKRGMYPVDREGVLLPPDDFTPEDTQQYPVFVNAMTVPQGPAGTPWGDPVVSGAARLAEVLAPQQQLEDIWLAFGLRAIAALPSSPGESNDTSAGFELLTDCGSRIEWGHPPGDDMLEPSAEQKLDRLRRYLDTYGSFDQPYGPRRLNIRHWEEITHEPLLDSPLR